MATGNMKWFAQALLDGFKKLHDLSADDIRMGIVTNAVVPTLATADPRWGAGGTTDFSANQVPLATGYAGPVALDNETWTLVSNVPTLRADIEDIPMDASGFTTGAYGIIFNNTDAGKRCLGFVEISAAGSGSNVGAILRLDWSGASNDMFTITQA